jgi:elongation factor G
LVALVGPGGAGKTTLAESLLFATGTIDRQGSVDAGNCVGDSSAEARARHGSTELNLMHFEFLGDRYALLDSPGSVGFAADAALGIAAADIAIVVVDPEPSRALLAEPILRQLEGLGVPHAVFVNKIDQARGSIQELLEALQPMSASPLIARQIPIREGERIAGFVDLALERAFHYRTGKPSERMEIPSELAERERSARFHMLEQLADHDDRLLEQLLMDETPDLPIVLADLARETRENLGVPVLFGSAMNGFGVRRLLKALRHEALPPSRPRSGSAPRTAARSSSRSRMAARWVGSLMLVFSGARSRKAPSCMAPMAAPCASGPYSRSRARKRRSSRRPDAATWSRLRRPRACALANG